MSKTIIRVEDAESGTDLTLTIDGMVGSTGEEFAGALIDLARQAYASTFTDSFNEQVVDMFLFEFERRQEEASRPSEFDLGWQAGHDAGTAAAIIKAGEPDDGTGLAAGDKVRIVHTGGDANPRHSFAVGDIVTLREEPDPDFYHRPRKDSEEKYDEAWRARRESGLSQWIHPDDFERVED